MFKHFSNELTKNANRLDFKNIFYLFSFFKRNNKQDFLVFKVEKHIMSFLEVYLILLIVSLYNKRKLIHKVDLFYLSLSDKNFIIFPFSLRAIFFLKRKLFPSYKLYLKLFPLLFVFYLPNYILLTKKCKYNDL